MHKKIAILAVLCLAVIGYARAQNKESNPPTTNQQASGQIAQKTDDQPTTSADTPAKPGSDAPATPNQISINATKIPSGSKIYVAPMGGFENYVVAGIVKKKVPVTIVADRNKADYEIKGSAETEKAGWAKMLFLSSDSSNEQASVNVTEIKSGTVVFAYSVHKANSVRGKQSAGEAIGKHLNEAMGKD